jgi:hypothetical protein
MPIVTRLRRGPWWWRRRSFHDEQSRRYYSRFEGEFQEMLSSVLTGEPHPIEDAVPGESAARGRFQLLSSSSSRADVDAASVPKRTRFEQLARWPDVATRTVLAPRRAERT